MSASEQLPILPESSCGGSSSVPVFNCIVILRRDPGGRLHGRVANLPNIEAEGTVERDVLFSITRQFRSAIDSWIKSEQAIPWLEPTAKAGPGEFERFIPIHL